MIELELEFVQYFSAGRCWQNAYPLFLYINENVSFEGALPEAHFLEQVELALEEKSQT